GRSWLLTGSALTVGDGLLPAPLDTVAGSIQVVWVRDSVERVSWTVHYARDTRSVPPAGYAEVLTPTTNQASYAAPVSFSGGLPAVPGCYAAPAAPGDYSINELFAMCANGDRDWGYVLVGVRGGAVPDGRVGLRMSASDHTVAELLPLFPDTVHAIDSTGGRRLLLARPAFAGVTGLAPDQLLPAPFEASSGSVEVFVRDFVLGDYTISRLGYAFPTVPDSGKALVMGPFGNITQRVGPRASRLDGLSATFPPDCASSDILVPMVL